MSVEIETAREREGEHEEQESYLSLSSVRLCEAGAITMFDCVKTRSNSNVFGWW